MRELCKTLLFYLFPVLFLAACGGGADAPPGKEETKREEAVSFVENSTAVVQRFAVASSSLDISISGGADQNLFEIVDVDPESGLKGLAFVQPPDFEKPLDADKDNIYEVDYTISTSTQKIIQSFTVTVEDANDIAPVVHTRTWTVEENDASAFLMIDATDVDTIGTLQYGVENKDEKDNLKFAVDLDTGKLTFISPPDFEAQSVYYVSIGAIDGVNASEFVLVTVTVTNVDDPPSTPELSLSYGDSQLILDWTDSIGATKYEVMYDNDGSGYKLLNEITNVDITSSEYTYDISNLPLGWLNVKFKIEAINGNNNNEFSTSNEVKTLGYFKASNTGEGDQFGQAVALSDDGMVMAVGAWHEDSDSDGIDGQETEDCTPGSEDNCAEDAGAVFIYSKDGAGVWSGEAYIKASNSDPGDQFGWAVALSADGQTLAVGAPKEASNAAAITNNGDGELDNSSLDAGAVYVFTRDLNGVWTQQAYIKPSNTGAGDQFGYSLSLSNDGNTLAVGAWWESSSYQAIVNGTSLGAADNDSAEHAGASYVFVRETESGTWTQQAYIKADNSGAHDWFGYAVSLSGDGDTLAVGANQEDSESTEVNVHVVDNDINFDSGAVYVYTRVTDWSQQSYIKPPNTGERDLFGESVSLSDDGNMLAVASRYEDSADGGLVDDCGDVIETNCATDSGAVYTFKRVSGTWGNNLYIKASNPGTNDEFGFSLALSGDGGSLLVGSHYEDSDGIGIGSSLAANENMNDSGAAYLFRFVSDVWQEDNYIKASNTDSNDEFGSAVAISNNGDTLAIGALGESSNAVGISKGGAAAGADNSKTASGAVYLY